MSEKPPPNQGRASICEIEAGKELNEDYAPNLPSGSLTVNERSPGVREILRLHVEIVGAIKTNLEKAIRIGELLSTAKAGTAHGQWLPWVEKHLPFTDRTARNYIRCYSQRERIKSESVSDLSAAYLLLAAPGEVEIKPEIEAPPKYIPSQGCSLMGHYCDAVKGDFTIYIQPHEQSGYFYTSVIWSDDHVSGRVDGDARGICASAVELVIRTHVLHEDVLTAMEWNEYPDEPHTHNPFLFDSHADYLQRRTQ